MPATPAPQTPMPGTSAPPVATPRVPSPERAAAAPETPKPAALTPFAPRKAAKGGKNQAPEAEMQVGICFFCWDVYLFGGREVDPNEVK